jgi:hypothetical protein
MIATPGYGLVPAVTGDRRCAERHKSVFCQFSVMRGLVSNTCGHHFHKSCVEVCVMSVVTVSCEGLSVLAVLIISVEQFSCQLHCSRTQLLTIVDSCSVM